MIIWSKAKGGTNIQFDFIPKTKKRFSAVVIVGADLHDGRRIHPQRLEKEAAAKREPESTEVLCILR